MNFIECDGGEVFPSKIICIGRNYVEHISELGNEVPTEPVIFLKPNSAITKNIIFNHSDELHYESELTFLIRSNQIVAVGVGLDLTKRQRQTRLKEKGLPWERAKAFDGSAVISKFVQFDGVLESLHFELLINQQVVQRGSYALMMNKPEQIVNEIISFMTIEDSDLIMTGTPKGVGVIHQGDEFVARVYQQQDLLLEASWRVE